MCGLAQPKINFYVLFTSGVIYYDKITCIHTIFIFAKLYIFKSYAESTKQMH